MTKSHIYTCKGTCSRSIELTVEDGVIKGVVFRGGCQGNTAGISKLVVGMEAEKVAGLLRGVDCGGKGTSCPDQLARAIEECLR